MQNNCLIMGIFITTFKDKSIRLANFQNYTNLVISDKY